MEKHDQLEAVVFDLDGVLTRTESVHAAAWKELFDSYLLERASREGAVFVPFDPLIDYRAYVDGMPRRDGVRNFLASRGIVLREGTPDDPEDAETVHALARRKDRRFREAIDRLGVVVDPGAVPLVRALRARGVAVGVASSSRNCKPILRRTAMLDLFDAVVDGNDIAALDLVGKPAPDMFLECLRRLGYTDPAFAVVVEDALAGVAAGKAGGFGLVLGVDRGDHRERLLASGAHWVVDGLEEVTLDAMEARRRAVRPSAGRGRGTEPRAGSPAPSRRGPEAPSTRSR